MTLLLFPPDEARPAAWWRLDGDDVTARGAGFGEAAPGELVVLVAPGEAVALHAIELPALTPPQARAAARLAVAGASAAALDMLHVAVAARRGAGTRAVAVVAAGAMAAWLAQAAAAGLDPRHVVPEPLLLPPPDEGEVHWTREPGRVVVRTAEGGHAGDVDLVALLVEGRVTVADEAAVLAGIAARLDPPALDLRQGAFVRRRRWQIDRRLVRRLGAIAAAILLVTLALQLVRIVRYEAATTAATARMAAAARAVLPHATRIADPQAQLAARLAELRGGGLGFSATAAALTAAIGDTGGTELTALEFDGSGRLTATVAGGRAEIEALVARLTEAGFVATAAMSRVQAERSLTDLTVQAR